MTPDNILNHIMSTAMRARYNYIVNKPYPNNVKTDIFLSRQLWDEINDSKFFKTGHYCLPIGNEPFSAMIDGMKVHIVSGSGSDFLHVSVTGGDV